MIISKKVSVNYNRIEAAEDNYFTNIHDAFELMLEASKTGSFKAGELAYTWELIERINTDNANMYALKLAKEITTYPSGVTDDSILELAVDGTLANVHYAIFCQAYKFILTTGLTGGSNTSFKKMMGQFSPDDEATIIGVKAGFCTYCGYIAEFNGVYFHLKTFKPIEICKKHKEK